MQYSERELTIGDNDDARQESNGRRPHNVKHNVQAFRSINRRLGIELYPEIAKVLVKKTKQERRTKNIHRRSKWSLSNNANGLIGSVHKREQGNLSNISLSAMSDG
jgi:hypothetical protein